MCEVPSRDPARMPYGLNLICSATAAAVGLVFNGYILFVLLWQRRIQTANNLLLLHLAFVDTVLCLVVLTCNTVLGVIGESSAASTHAVVGPGSASDSLSTSSACHAHGFVWTMLPVVAIWTVCGLSCDRYAAISTPLHYSRLVNTRRACVFLAASWLLGGGLAVAPLLGMCTYRYSDARSACSARCSRENAGELTYAIVYSSLAVLLPAIIILICNLHILLIARYHRHRIVSAIYEVTLRAQATVTHQRNPCYLSKFKGRDAFFTITQLMGSLVVLAAPYFCLIVWETMTGVEQSHALVSVTTVLLACMPPVNAYVYGVKSRVLRQTFKQLLQRYLYKQQASLEIDRRLSVRSTTGSGPTARPSASRRFSAPATGYAGGAQRTTPCKGQAGKKLWRRQSDLSMNPRTSSKFSPETPPHGSWTRTTSYCSTAESWASSATANSNSNWKTRKQEIILSLSPMRNYLQQTPVPPTVRLPEAPESATSHL